MHSIKRISSDLLLVFVWTVLTLIFVLAPVLSDTFIRTMLGIPMVLFIPGYVLIAALFPGKDELEGVERVALSFGLSIAVVPLLGLALNFTFGIRLMPILFTLCFYTIFLLFIAEFRREQLPEEERFRVPFSRAWEKLRTEFTAPRTGQDKVLTIILVFSIAFAIGMIYFVITTPKIGERFTEFYILDPEGKGDNYPAKLKYKAPTGILVGVVNHEYALINYTVQVVLENESLTEAGVTLDHNETWEETITFVPDRTGSDLKLEFWLFKEDNFSAPYRNLHLWVNVTK